jgi:hypothetical protein
LKDKPMKALILAAAVAALGLASAAHADAPPAKPKQSCFFTRDWTGWRSPDEKTIYLRVNVKDIYKIDLSSGSSLLTWPDSHLINEVRGTDSVCSAIDLDLRVSNDHVVEPLFVKSIAKLTPEEVAAIPKKYLP